MAMVPPPATEVLTDALTGLGNRLQFRDDAV